MSSELPGEDVQDLFADPAALGERRESEVVRVDLAQTCNDTHDLNDSLFVVCTRPQVGSDVGWWNLSL